MNQSKKTFRYNWLLRAKDNQVEDTPTCPSSQNESDKRVGKTELEVITDVSPVVTKDSASLLDATFNLVSFILGVGFRHYYRPPSVRDVWLR